jgi:hypothetical protein
MADFDIDYRWKNDFTPVYEIQLHNIVVPRRAKYLRLSGFSHFDGTSDPKNAAQAYGTPAFVPIMGGNGTN